MNRYDSHRRYNRFGVSRNEVAWVAGVVALSVLLAMALLAGPMQADGGGFSNLLNWLFSR